MSLNHRLSWRKFPIYANLLRNWSTFVHFLITFGYSTPELDMKIFCLPPFSKISTQCEGNQGLQNIRIITRTRILCIINFSRVAVWTIHAFSPHKHAWLFLILILSDYVGCITTQGYSLWSLIVSIRQNV